MIHQVYFVFHPSLIGFDSSIFSSSVGHQTRALELLRSSGGEGEPDRSHVSNTDGQKRPLDGPTDSGKLH